MDSPSNAINSDHQQNIVHPQHAAGLLQHLLLSIGDGGDGLSDVVLIAGKNGQRVSAHRAILAECSPYFKALFTRDMLESTASEVTLGNDVHGDYLKPLVRFCYTGTIKICANTVAELVQTATRLQLDEVVSQCCIYMERYLDPSNCLGVASLADLLNLTSLKKVAEKYICKYFWHLSLKDEFLKLKADKLMLLISNDGLMVRSEDTVFHSVMAWLNYELDEEGKRSKHTAALLGLVRLSYLPQSLLTGRVKELCRKHSCMPLFEEAFKEANLSISSRRIKPRISMQSRLLAVSHNDAEKISVGVWSSCNDEWSFYDHLVPFRKYFAAEFHNNEIYIVGGVDAENSKLGTVESINLDTLIVSELTPMMMKRSHHRIAVLDGYLYAAGGRNAKNGLRLVEHYNLSSRIWVNVAPMSFGRYNFGLAVVNGRLFAVGGHGPAVGNTTECYDPETNKWTQRANMNDARESFGITSIYGFLFVVGGRNLHDLQYWMEFYDSQVDKWTHMSVLSRPQSVSCTFLEHSSFVCFNNDELTETSSFGEYNRRTDTWTKLATSDWSSRYTTNKSVMFLFKINPKRD